MGDAAVDNWTQLYKATVCLVAQQQISGQITCYLPTDQTQILELSEGFGYRCLAVIPQAQWQISSVEQAGKVTAAAHEPGNWKCDKLPLRVKFVMYWRHPSDCQMSLVQFVRSCALIE